MTGLRVGYLYSLRENRSDKISGGNQVGSDTLQNGSDIIRYPTVILSPAWHAIIIFLIPHLIFINFMLLTSYSVFDFQARTHRGRGRELTKSILKHIRRQINVRLMKRDSF